MDALLDTGFLSSIVLLPLKMTAPAPQGPGLLIHDPSVKDNIEFCGRLAILSNTIYFPDSACLVDLFFDEPRWRQYSGGDIEGNRPLNRKHGSMRFTSILVRFFISLAWSSILLNGETIESGVSFCFQLSNSCWIGIWVWNEFIFAKSRMAISSRRRCNGMTPAATSRTSTLAMLGRSRQRLRPFLCIESSFFNWLSFLICQILLAYDRMDPTRLW